jgi:hypothetical protein
VDAHLDVAGTSVCNVVRKDIVGGECRVCIQAIRQSCR